MSCRSARAALFVAGLGVLSLTAGCTIRHVHAGNRVTAEQVAALATITTKAEVLEQVGPPAAIELLPQGSVFLYRHVRSRGEGLEITAVQASFERSESDRRDETLRVEFDKQGRVVSYGFRAEPFPGD